MKYLLSIALIYLASPLFAQVISLEADFLAGGSSSNPQFLTAYNGKLYFAATDGAVNYATELFSYDGNSVQLVADIYPGNVFGSQPRDLYVYNGKLYFSAIDGVHGRELWVHDGDSTYLFKDLDADQNGYPQYFQEYDSLLYFQAYQLDAGKSYGIELFVTDGDSVWLAEDIYAGSISSDPEFLEVYDNKLFFRAVSNNNMGFELYSFNGDSAKLEADIAPGSSSSTPTYLKTAGSNLYFSANVSGIGRELFKFDGTTANLASDINAGTSSSNPSFLIEYKNELYFRASDGVTGSELWSYDGTTATNYDLIVGPATSNPRSSFVFKNTFFISLDGCATNYGLSCNLDDIISFDGDTFQNISNNFDSQFYPQEYTEYDGKLFFNAGNSSTGRELWSFTPDSVCTIPKNQIVSPVNLSTVLLNWEVEPNAIAYEIRGTEVGTTGFVTIAINGGLTTSYKAKGLFSSKTYAWQVRAMCDINNYSDWSGYDTFKIDDLYCQMPANFVSDITPTSAVLRWNIIANAGQYLIIGRDINSPKISFLTIDDGQQDSLWVQLAPGNTYVWQIRAECPASPNVSLFTPAQFFSTPQGQTPKLDLVEVNVSIHPNPMSEYTYVQTQNEDISSIKLYDLQGKLARQVESSSNVIQLKRGDLDSGVYVLIIESAGVQYHEKLIVE